MFSLSVQGGKLLQRPYIPMLQEDSVRRHLPEPLRAVATFAYLTGWRTKSEILPTQWHQVDLEAGVVRLDPGTTKNREGRVLVFGGIDELRDVLEGQWAEHKGLEEKGTLCAAVFHRKGRQIRSYRRAWETACKRAGCPGRIPHDFRRTAVRNFVRAGIPDVVAMRMSGHKTRSVFDCYDIVSEGDLTDAGHKLNDFMGTISGTIGAIRAQVYPARGVNDGVVDQLTGAEGQNRTADTVIFSQRTRHFQQIAADARSGRNPLKRP
jgi:integrase